MDSYIRYELWLLGQSVFLGAVLLLCYSLVRTVKLLLGHNSLVKGILDIIYWTGTGLCIFIRIYQINQGVPRSFLFGGMILGAYLAHLFPGPFFEKICYKILDFPVRIIKKSINRLLFYKKRCKILARQLKNQYENSTGKRFQLKRGRKFGKVREKEQKKEKENWK